MPINSGSQSSAGRQPETPTIGAATAGNASASIAFTSPNYTGKPNTSLTYTATTTPGSVTGTSASSPISVTGLTNGVSYTAVVKLSNTVADSLNSSASNSFTPVAPPPPPPPPPPVTPPPVTPPPVTPPPTTPPPTTPPPTTPPPTTPPPTTPPPTTPPPTTPPPTTPPPVSSGYGCTTADRRDDLCTSTQTCVPFASGFYCSPTD